MAIVRDMPASDYFAHPAINKSLLDLVGRAPFLAKMQIDGLYDRTQTPAMQLGTLFHTLVLEPLSFGSRYDIVPNVDRRTKAGKEAYAEFQAASRGKEIITEAMFEQAQCMAESVLGNPSAAYMLRQGIPEASIFCELEGSECKARIDWMRVDGLLVDLKSTKDASPNAFARTCATFDYPVQAAFYTDVAEAAGITVRDFVFIACETEAPYLCAAYTMDPEAISKGRMLYLRRLELLQRCMEDDCWPGIGNGLVQSLRMPAYYGSCNGEIE